MTISKDKGLCILACKDHSIQTLLKKFLHVPVNPFYKLEKKTYPEIFAPVVINPNIIQVGSHGGYTTSAPKIEIVGGYFGMSSFSLYPFNNYDERPKPETFGYQLISLWRDEIYKYSCNKEGIEYTESIKSDFKITQNL